jgi:hypothetical protein
VPKTPVHARTNASSPSAADSDEATIDGARHCSRLSESRETSTARSASI